MATSADVPGRVPIAIDGHAYMADPTIVRATVPVLRQQADTSPEAGEQTLNPQGLWRRSQESWHHGAGQDFLDGRHGASPYMATYVDPSRFRSSKGINIWTKGQVSLLHPTMKTWGTTNTNLQLAVTQVVGGNFYLYASDGTEVYFNSLPYGQINSLALQTGTGWTATNATLSAQSEWFRLTATGSATMSATSATGTAGFAVDPGRTYGYAWESTLASGGTARIPTISVTWYTAAGAVISTTPTSTATGNDNPGIVVSGSATAPANAAFASVTVSYTTASTVGDAHDVRAVTFGPYDDVSTVGYSDTWFSCAINSGQTAQTVQSLATNGSWVWAALGASGLHRTIGGAGGSIADVPAAPAGGQISLVGYANGFLLAAGSAVTTNQQNTLWSVNDPLGTPSLSVIKTHPDSNFIWTGISPGRSCVYVYGNSGGNGEVYKITLDPNTGGLSTAASFASYLPDGETINALQFYAGGIIMGTGKGVRIGTAAGDGSIDYGPLIPTNWPVRCLEPQDRYCWFGWTKYDATNSGLGRIDLGFLTDPLTPAWTSDLMTSDTSSGDVVSCVTLAPYGYLAAQRPPVRVFTVAGQGIYIEDPGSRVPSGQILTGSVRYSTSEPKTARSLDVRHHALPAGASVAVEMQRDASGTWESLGASSTTGSYGPPVPLDALSETAEAFEFRFTLNRPTPSGADYSKSPEMTRWTAKVLPTPSTVDETFQIPLIMRREALADTGDGAPYPIDVPTEIAYLKGLERTRQLVTLQVGSETIPNCYVAQSAFHPDVWGPGRQWLEGTYLIEVSTARG